DASVGGKTGVDHPAGKNLVGAFHAPAEVLADPDFLDTLDIGRRAEGYAEAVKHGVILDAAYAEWLGANASDLLDGDAAAVEHAVVRSVRHKAEVVAGDEFEAGRRKVLNFGHTVAHALELGSGYLLPHGHAVAVGMVAEARIGEALGWTAAGTAEAIRGVVRAFDLPDSHPLMGRVHRLAGMMITDKKTRRGIVHMVPLREVGRTADRLGSSVPIPGDELLSVLKHISSTFV
ncbi:MAG: 3-dehydroquinate synthase, partial [Gemmatimonadetes bacterium]|nr:3-dehydroquinate synthase [Gemmatimonadota bacterium]